MNILENESLCNGCSSCANICPKNCIAMKANNEGFLFPKIDTDKCNKCGICQKICPINKTQVERTGNSNILKAFAVTHKNEKTLLNSSSGGAFTLFAEHIINNGGVVFGVRYDENWKVIHDYTETTEGLTAFMLSKSVQSEIGNAYKLVKSFLALGKEVLFSGTPCQIGGLKLYLQKDYDNLICIDLICRGVPSPKAWQNYIEYREKTAGAKIKEILPRVKNDKLWKMSCWYVKFIFTNNTEYYKIKSKDIYKIADSKGLIVRRSCFNCGFKAINRISDITIADFWGVENIAPEAYNSKGVSLCLIHSQKGIRLFDNVNSNSNFTEVDAEKAVSGNPMALNSIKEQKYRNIFMKGIVDNIPFDKLLLNTYLQVQKLLLDFCINRKIYIYGAGFYGKLVEEILSFNNIKIDCFLVSKEIEYFSYNNIPIYIFSEVNFCQDNVGIIVALKTEFANQILPVLIEKKLNYHIFNDLKIFDFLLDFENSKK